MKRLQSRLRGDVLENPPRTEREESAVRAVGYVPLPSGEWIRPEPSFAAPLWLVQEYPYGHRCKVCRARFRSKRGRDKYCWSCRSIIEGKVKELDSLLERAQHATPETKRHAAGVVESRLACECGWIGNATRIEPRTIRFMRLCLREFVEASLRHSLRHIFPGRFARGRRTLRKKYGFPFG